MTLIPTQYFYLTDKPTLLGLCVALGIGLLVGAERERRKGVGPTRGAAGVRTFTVASLLGAVSALSGSDLVLAVAALVVGVLALVAYQRARNDDPGITTEIALLLTCLLGSLAMHEAALAAAVGTTLAVLLAARNRIHYFVRGVLTEHELHDGLLFLAMALIVWPFAPNGFMGPFDALNPHTIVRLILLVMAINALGYITTRQLGVHFGLPLAGFVAGFISSTATIYSMGNRANKHATQMPAAVAGAALSSIATIIQMAVVVLSVQPALLSVLLKPLLSGGLAACVYSAIFLIKRSPSTADAQQNENFGRAFDLKMALIYSAIFSVVLVLSAGLHAMFGSRGAILAAAITGFADPHAAAASIASLAVANKIPTKVALWSILIGLTTNSIMKAIVSFQSGGIRFATRIVPGLLLVISAIWFGAWHAV